jgi:hypothetical protein
MICTTVVVLQAYVRRLSAQRRLAGDETTGNNRMFIVC